MERAYHTFDKLRQVDQGAIADNKRLEAVLAMIRDEQRCRGPVGRAGAISATPVSSKSAELLYVPRELTLTR